MSLLVQCTKREAFHTLRTIEQLGYMVRIRPSLPLAAASEGSIRDPVYVQAAEHAVLCRCGCPHGAC